VTCRGRHRDSSARRRVTTASIFLPLLIVGIYFRVRAQASDMGSAAPVSAQAPILIAPPTMSSTPPVIIGVDPTTRSVVAAKVTVPAHLTVSSIGVSTDLQALKLLKDGSLQAPSRWAEAGWYSGGAAPGEIGPAVIVGHIDSTRGPAVFYRLRQIVVGARILITDRDGTPVRFVVDDVHAYPKDTFPTVTVYGPTPIPELRLITCTGEFDPEVRSYRSNLVVFAHLVPS
jgi:hypothetical protein